MNLKTIPAPLSAGAPKFEGTSYIHYRTFFQNNSWDAHDLVGELMARGITQIAMHKDGADWTVAWREPTPPDVLLEAEKTPA